MIFSSATFLFIFLPLFLAGYYLINDRYRTVFIFCVSIVFYSWGEPKNVVWLLVSIIINYFLAIIIEKCLDRSNTEKRVIVIVATVLNLSLLYVFKYFNFTLIIINKLFLCDFREKNIILPIGISFYVFKSLSYIFDVYLGKIKAEKNIIYLGTYIAFFPQLMAGPIARFNDLAFQIKRPSTSTDKFYNGIIRFMIGFSKKVLLSDQLLNTVSDIFSNDGYSAPTAWLGAIAYTLEIYYDFSGYSDMAIGLGLMMGIETKENFNVPYIATSIQDFWRRWHISLSTWFRDYVYFPLGGSKCSALHTALNITVVFFLTGLWHGANWNFIAWGLFYVVFLIAERTGFKKVLVYMPKFIQHVYALVIIVIGWVFFRAEGLHAALRYIKNMFIFNGRSISELISVVDKQLVVCVALGILFSSSAVVKIREFLLNKTWLHDMCVCLVFLLSIGYMWGAGFSPFLYFQF